MRNVKKSLPLAAIALISVALTSCWRDEVKKAATPTPIGKPQLIGDTKHAKKIRSIAFSPDGKTLAVTFSSDNKKYSTWNDNDKNVIKLWDLTSGADIHSFNKGVWGMSGEVTNSSFSPDGKTQAIGREDGTIKLRDVTTGNNIHILSGHAGEILSIAFHPAGKILASASSDNTTKLWEVATGETLVSLVSYIDDTWVAVSAYGRFDTDQIDNVKDLHWQIPSLPQRVLPLEVFMRYAYEPKLLSRVLAREQLRPVPDLSTLNLTQPEVKIIGIVPDSAETFQVTVEVASVKSTVQKDTDGNLLESGVYDVQLFRDEQLVGYAPKDSGAVKLNTDGKAILKFSQIKWPRLGLIYQPIEFSAYAFNVDRIKSATARASTEPEIYHKRVKGPAYLISLGVNACEREGLNLRYAANDARIMQKSLATRLASQGEYQEVVSLPLISDYTVTLADGRTLAAHDATSEEVRAGRKRVTENTATKAHLRAVLDVLAGRQGDAALLKQIPNADKLRAARPEDLVQRCGTAKSCWRGSNNNVAIGCHTLIGCAST